MQQFFIQVPGLGLRSYISAKKKRYHGDSVCSDEHDLDFSKHYQQQNEIN